MSDVKYVDSTPPDMVGPYGKAWKMDAQGIYNRHPGGPPPDVTVASWIVEARWAHPIWHSYMVCAVSLRDMPGLPKAVVHKQGATHEVMVYALNPDMERPIDDRPKLLIPANFHGQWEAGTDEEAARYVEETVRLIVDGKMSPDTDYIRSWMFRFSDSNIKGNKAEAGQTKIIIEQPPTPREHSHAPPEPPVEIVIPPKPGPQDLN